MVFIIAIRLKPRGRGHAGIALLKTIDAEGVNVQMWTQEALVAWVRAGGQLGVANARRENDLSVAVLDGTPRYLRAFDRMKPTDAILHLPRF